MPKYKKNPFIFITNDDGPNSIGLNKLIDVVKKITNNYLVVVPETNCSGYGHSITLSRPVRLKKVKDNYFLCDGTPTDCVMLGFFKILKKSTPDLLVSGINLGENLGDDATYSGTLCAALEGSLRGVKSLAISKLNPIGEKEDDWSCVDKFLKNILLDFFKTKVLKNNFFSINFPNSSSNNILGYKLTRLARRKPLGKYIIRKDPKNISYYWLTTERSDIIVDKESDVWAVKNNYISISPLNIDMTENIYFNKYKDQFNKN